MNYSEKAYAKINLFLNVTGQRDDGYHEIRSVMQSISLYDMLTLEVEEASEFSVSLICENTKMDCGESNLICQTAMYIHSIEPEKVRGAHRFSLCKQIPISAGMAGGSADAAAVIRLMNRAHKLNLTDEEMCTIGKKLGADIPFCIHGGTALCEGIGEKITDFAPPKPFSLAVAIGDSSVSTPVAFSLLDKMNNNFSDKYRKSHCKSELKIEPENIFSFANSLYNIFEDVIIPHVPNIAEIKDIMMRNGALGALMSGSGPSAFGIFPCATDAKNAVSALSKEGYRAYLCHTVNKYP